MNTSIAVVPTPNPDAMMFKVPEALVNAGTYEGKRGDDLSALPLAQKILEVEGTELVLIAPRFVTVRKQADADWMVLRPLLVPLLIRFIESGKWFYTAGTTARKRSRATFWSYWMKRSDPQSPKMAEMSLPRLRRWHGDIRLIGACGDCPSSLTTLKMGIERLMVEEMQKCIVAGIN